MYWKASLPEADVVRAQDLARVRVDDELEPAGQDGRVKA